MKKRKSLKMLFGLFILTLIISPAMNVNATNSSKFGDSDGIISGINYQIDTESKVVELSSDANVSLSGNGDGFKILAKENAKNITISLDNYEATNGGWKSTIELSKGSEVVLILNGENHLQAGEESSVIGVPETSSLTINGDGTLYAKIDNKNCSASSAVIGSSYNNPFGNITINSGTIYTSYTGGGVSTGIGSGYWNFDAVTTGIINLNGGEIHSDVIGSKVQGSTVTLNGNGKAIIYTDLLLVTNKDNFNGIIFDESGKNGEVIGKVTLDKNLSIPADGKLSVNKEATLTILPGVTLTNEGEIVNDGTVINTGTINNINNIINNGNVNSSTVIENVSGNEIKTVYVITTSANNGGSISPSESIVESGENQILTIVANSGYTIKTVKVNGLDKTGDVIDGKLTLSNITQNMNISVEFEKITSTTNDTINDDTVDTSTVENPKTSDNIVFYILLGIVSIVGLTGVGIYFKKYAYNKTR